MYVPHNAEEIRHACKSKHNLKRKNQVVLLVITDGEKWHYLAVKKLSTLLKGITSKHKGDFYCLNCFNSYSTKEKLKKHRSVCENHDYCYVEMSEKDNKILKYNYGEKSMKAPFITYADIKPLLEKMNTCHNNPEKSSTTKTNEHTASGYSLFAQCSFDTTKNKLDYYRGKICMENFFLDLKEHVTKTMNYETINKKIPLTKREKNWHNMQKVCHISKIIFSTDYKKTIVIIPENTEVLLMIYTI